MNATEELRGHLNELNNEMKHRISLEKLVDDLKLFESEKDLNVIEEYSNILMEDENSFEFENAANCTEVLNECIKIGTNILLNPCLMSAEHEILLRAILFLLSLKKLNTFHNENVESNDLRIFIISVSCKLIKLCLNKDYYYQTGYYIHRSLTELEKLENSYDNTNISGSNLIQQNKTILYLLNVERLLKENKYEEILLEIKNYKANIIESKQYQEYFVILCYNLSLKCREKENYELMLSLLLVIYDICKTAEYISRNMKKALHFLICTCLDYKPYENWQYAVNALEVANGKSLDIFYIIGMLKAAVISQQQSKVEDILSKAAAFEHITVEDIGKIIRELKKNQLNTQAAEFIRRVRKKPLSNTERFSLISLEIPIFISQKEEMFYLLENAMDIVKQNDIPFPLVHSLCRILLSHAKVKFREKQIEESLMLYNCCSQLSETCESDKSLYFHVQLQICLCYIEMEEWCSVKRVFSGLKLDALGSDPLCAYIALQIALMYDDENLAEEILNKFENNDKIEKVLLSCCQKFFQSGKRKFLFRILEAMLLKYQVGAGSMLPCKISHCLIILCLEDQGCKDTWDKCLLYMEKAFNALQNNQQYKDIADHSNWFSRVAWNLALSPDIEPLYRFEYFLRCCCFSELSTKNPFRLKNSLMMAAAAGLQVVRKMSNSKDEASISERNNILRKIMTVIEKCKTLETGSNIALLRVLCLYEFEAKCHAKEWSDGTDSFQEVLNLPFMDVKTLDHIAAIVHEFMPSNFKIIIEALKGAIQKITENKEKDCLEASKTYHSLIQVMFHAQEYLSVSYEEENLSICSQLLGLINEVFVNYPKLEILWLMTKCWNWGIQKLATHDNLTAYKWCTLAMGFMEKLDSLKALHEKKLQNMYSTYFVDFKETKETSSV